MTPPPDFTLSANPTSQSLTAGSSTPVTYAITVNLQNGFNGTVNFSVHQPGWHQCSGEPHVEHVGDDPDGERLPVERGHVYDHRHRDERQPLAHRECATGGEPPPPDFSLTPSPTTANVFPGSDATFTITVNSVKSLHGDCHLQPYLLARAPATYNRRLQSVI